MATLRDDLVSEGTALLSITSHIGDFLADRRSERTYLVETEAFFDYIDNTLRAVHTFVHQVVDADSTPTSARLLADLRDLKALELVLSHLYRVVRQTCDADTLAIPYPIVAYINSLMSHVPESTGARDARILALATDEFNFLHQRLDRLREACSRCSHLPPFPPAVGIVAFPYTERDSICLNSLLFHEIGHFLFQKAHLKEAMRPALHSLEGKVKSIASTGLLFDRPLLAAMATERILGWCQELYCDLIATSLVGPSYAIAFDRMVRLQGAGADSDTRFTDLHPADMFRRSCIGRILESQGWLKAIEEVDKEKANIPFVQATRADAARGWNEAIPGGPGLAKTEASVDTSVYRYPLDNVELSKLMMEAFFEVVPRIFEHVRKLKLHLEDYVDDFRKHYDDVTCSLLHLTVPEMGRPIHPVTVLGCGSLLLRRDLHEIHQLSGKPRATISVEDRLWVEDRINRLVMKAIEDALVLKRWEHLTS
jgi:hypothetical protein